MPYNPPHQLDVALANVGAEAPTAERIEVIDACVALPPTASSGAKGGTCIVASDV
jgi:hypothetical protein